MQISNSFPSVALAVALTVAAGLPGLRPPVQQPLQIKAMTEIKGGNGGHFYVDAQINHEHLHALVDTGATAVVLSYENAESVGLHPGALTFDVPVATANGVSNAARVKLSQVEIDNVRVEDVDAMVAPKGALNGTLIGMSYLSRLSSFRVENGVLTLKN